MSNHREIQLCLAATVIWLFLISVYPLTTTIDLNLYSIPEYLKHDLESSYPLLITGFLIPFVYGLVALILMVVAQYKKYILLNRLCWILFSLIIVHVAIMTLLVFVPTLCVALLPLGYCCYKLKSFVVSDKEKNH